MRDKQVQRFNVCRQTSDSYAQSLGFALVMGCLVLPVFGCGESNAANEKKPDAVMRTKERPSHEKPDWETAVYSKRDNATGVCCLKARNSVLNRAGGGTRQFTLRSLWHYDLQKKVWSKTDLHADEPITLKPTANTVDYDGKNDPVIRKLPLEVGLYWANWTEDGHRAGTLVFCGPVLCNDVDIGPPPKDYIATCVPLPKSASAAFVPDPKVYCRETDAAQPANNEPPQSPAARDHLR